jgi:hypothetical protein
MNNEQTLFDYKHVSGLTAAPHAAFRWTPYDNSIINEPCVHGRSLRHKNAAPQ